MPDTIAQSLISALISGLSSIVVALIGKGRNGSARSGGTRVVYDIPGSHRRVWTFAVVVFVAWAIYSPLFIDWKLAGINLFAIAPGGVLLTAIWPIRPSSCVAVVLMLCALHFLLFAVWHSIEGVASDLGPNLVILLGFAFLTALVCGAVARWRVSGFRRGIGPVAAVHQGQPSLAEEISKLNELRQSGALSEAEFTKAKKRLLKS